VFACDFSGIIGEADCAPGVTVGCVGLVTRRPRRQCGGGRDEEDRRRPRAELLLQVAEDGLAGAAVPHRLTERQDEQGWQADVGQLRYGSRRAKAAPSREEDGDSVAGMTGFGRHDSVLAS
jgi:hypothetical protein